MTPIDHIAALYRGRPDMSFDDDLAAHFLRGYVISTPEAFAMGRPVRREWTTEKLADPFHVEPLESADCWFIWALAGDLRIAVRWLPRELPWFGFAQRGSPARFLEAKKVLAKAR